MKPCAMSKPIDFFVALCYSRFNKLNRALQGRVKFPIGGTVREQQCRTGETPVPTVTVWMEEDASVMVFAMPFRA